MNQPAHLIHLLPNLPANLTKEKTTANRQKYPPDEELNLDFQLHYPTFPPL